MIGENRFVTRKIYCENQKNNFKVECFFFSENRGAPAPRESNVIPPPAYPENIELYENEATEPRYSSIQQLQTSLRIGDGLNLIENGIPANLVRACTF